MPIKPDLTKEERDNAMRLLYDLLSLYGSKSKIAQAMGLSPNTIIRFFSYDGSPSRKTYSLIQKLAKDNMIS